jgi:hypothetical protein
LIVRRGVATTAPQGPRAETASRNADFDALGGRGVRRR